MREEGLPRSRTRRRPQGRRPGASAARSPGVSLTETPLPPAPNSAAAERSHPRLCRGTQILQAVGVGGAVERVPQLQDPSPGSSSSASQRETPTPEAAMMDYEPLHNEARPRPRPRPQRRRNLLSEVRPAAGTALLHAAHLQALGSSLRQPGSARPFKGSFSDHKVSDEEAPASSVLSLVFNNRSPSPRRHPIGQWARKPLASHARCCREECWDLWSRRPRAAPLRPRPPAPLATELAPPPGSELVDSGQPTSSLL